MYDPATELMETLARGAEVDEALAGHFAALAEQTARWGDETFASAFRSHGRLHRAKAIELRARLGALEEQYGSLHLEQGRASAQDRRAR